VTRAASAQGALGALADEREIDLVLSDIMMPGTINGMGLAREVRRRRPCAPILLTTGYAGAAQFDGQSREILQVGEPLPKSFTGEARCHRNEMQVMALDYSSRAPDSTAKLPFHLSEHPGTNARRQ
jgi:CheY-like chemotaxis protein